MVFLPLLAVLGLAASTARADCRAAAALLQDAIQAGDIDKVGRVTDEMGSDTSCDDVFLRKVRRVAALAYYKEAQSRVAAGKPLAAQGDLLLKAVALSPVWQVLALLGDVEHDQRNYDKAATYYQQALNDIENPVTTPAAPKVEVIETIYRRANQSRLLADNFTAAPLTRSGAPGGVAMASIRGFEPKVVPVPITFETNSTDFTAKGRQAAEEMAAMLASERPAQVVIVGHTDGRGAPAHNQQLSERRARAVADFVRARGYQGQVVTVGRGPSEPFQADDPSRYTQDERWQMDRRVELRR